MISSSRCGHWELLLCVLCALCVSSSAQEWKSVHDGVEYAQVEKEISGLKVKMNLLRLDLTKVRLDVHHVLFSTHHRDRQNPENERTDLDSGAFSEEEPDASAAK